MAFIPVPNTAQLNIRYELDGQEIQNTLYSGSTDSTNPTELFALASSVAQAWESIVMPALSSGLVLREVNAVGLGSETEPSVTFQLNPTVPGGVIGAAVPANCALAITFGTTARGRSSRGRIYLPGIPLQDVTGSVVDSAVAENLRSRVANAITAGIIDTGRTHVIVSRFSGGVPRAQGLTLVVSEIRLTDNVIDSQRRRLPGRGT